MTSITHEKSAAIAAAEELVAAALRLRALPVPAEERQQLLTLMARAAEALGATANGLISVVYEEAPPGGTIGEPDGWLPLPGQLIQELDEAFDGAIKQRNALQEAATIVEEMLAERRGVTR